MTDSTVNQIKSLARTALKDSDPNRRTEAILALRRHDHPQIFTLLERICTNDDNPGVRDLAKNVLTKKRIQAGIPTNLSTGGASSAQEAAPRQQSGAWECSTCGGDNQKGDTTCRYCGAPRASRTAAAPASEPVTSPKSAFNEKAEINRILRDKVYLLNPDNKAFLRGKIKNPVNVGGGGSGPGCMMLFMAVFSLIGFGILYMAFQSYLDYRALEDHGVVTTGQYYDRHVSTDSEGDDTYYVHFAFVVDDGRVIQKEQSVSRGEYNQMEPGTVMEALYDPGNPSNAVINGTNNNEYVFFAIFGVMWSLICWSILLVMFFAWRRSDLLIRQGRVIDGEVIQSSAHYDSDDDYVIDIRYFVRAPDGSIIEKRVHGIRNEMRKRGLPPPGMQLAVMYVNPSMMEPL